ncbi:MAG TPA: hypothetical protein VFG99_07325, partial [Chloroflexia bacterium]|nr:hypothetical protein [Chloroflexia bacterium]
GRSGASYRSRERLSSRHSGGLSLTDTTQVRLELVLRVTNPLTPVILNEVKNLVLRVSCLLRLLKARYSASDEILRCAQNDKDAEAACPYSPILP